jgi:hypothetical protein
MTTDMYDFLIGMAVFAVIAIAFGALLLYMVRSQGGRELKISRRAFIYSLVIPMVLGLVFLGFFSFYAWHETPGFCGEMCHAMEPNYIGYTEPENNSMMIVHKEEGVACTACHTGPGWWGQVDALLAVPHEFVSEAFNLYDPDDLGGFYDEESCLKCHDGEVAIALGEVKAVDGSMVNPHLEEEPCMNCHPAHSAGFGVSLKTCEICHGTALDDWDESMGRHSQRMGKDCLECHDRAHPEDARVPWVEIEDLISMEFCSDCHIDEYNVYLESGTEVSMELYGECVDCHLVHDVSDSFHFIGEAYKDCIQCHPSYRDTGGLHDRTVVTYGDFPAVGNNLCVNCHTNESADLDANIQHRGLYCTSCHTEHPELSVEFDDCTVCHRDTIPDWHDDETDGCTKSACHGTGWFH